MTDVPTMYFDQKSGIFHGKKGKIVVVEFDATFGDYKAIIYLRFAEGQSNWRELLAPGEFHNFKEFAIESAIKRVAEYFGYKPRCFVGRFVDQGPAVYVRARNRNKKLAEMKDSQFNC